MPDYREFILTIHTKDAAGSYPLSARSPEGDAEGVMTLTAEDHAMNALLEGGEPPEPKSAALQQIGGMLFQRLFPENIRKLYDLSVKNDYHLRIRLIAHPPELVWLTGNTSIMPKKPNLSASHHTPCLCGTFHWMKKSRRSPSRCRCGFCCLLPRRPICRP